MRRSRRRTAALAVLAALAAGGAAACSWAGSPGHPVSPAPSFPTTPGLLRGEQLPTLWPGPAPAPLSVRQVVVLDRYKFWSVVPGPGHGSGLLQTVSGGATWRMHYRTGLPVTDLQFVSPRQGYAVENGCPVGQCRTSALLSTRDGGLRWSTMYATHGHRLKSISFVSPAWGYRVTGGDHTPWALAFSVDGGATWSPRHFPCGPRSLAAAISFVTRSDGYAACGPPASHPGPVSLWATGSGGRSWVAVGAPAAIRGRLTGLVFLSKFKGYLATSAGLWVTHDGGRRWAAAAMPQIAAGRSVTSLGRFGRHAYLLADGRAWEVSSDGGWTSLYPLPDPQGSVVWPTARVSYGVGERGAPTAVVAGQAGARNWATVGYLPGPAATLVSVSPRILWAVKPRLYVSRDGGRTWAPAPLPPSPPAVDASACGRYGFVLLGPTTIRVTTNGLQSLSRAHRLPFDATGVACQTPGVGFALGHPRSSTVRLADGKVVHVSRGTVYLWRTADGGGSWVPYRLPPVLSIAPPAMLRFSGPRLGWMWSANGYWVTSDGGQSWVARSVPAGVAIRSLAFESPLNAVMVTNTGVYTTSTGGRNWVPGS